VKRADLKLPIPEESLFDACDLSETGYWSAFESHYRSATLLAGDPQLQQESLLAMRFAVECFLKHVLCAVRWHLLGQPSAPMKKSDFFRPEKLGHALADISRWAKSLIEDLRDDAVFDALIGALPTATDWVSERYRGDGSSSDKATREYAQTKAAFDGVLQLFGVPQPGASR